MKKLFVLLVIAFIPLNVFSQNWQKIETVFAPSGVTVMDFSAPVFGDLDADGDFDLVLGNIDLRIDYFRNTGTNQVPVFEKDTSMFGCLYWNGYQFTNADYPALADLDNDNDLDLVISGYNGCLYYENKGDSTTPVWVKVDTVFTAVNAAIGTDARPAFADLDNDGDLDIIIGIGESLFGGPTAGITMGFRNNGTASAPSFQRDDNLVSGIPDVGLNSYPAPADLDADGDFDLLIGRDGAAVYYYRNTGTAAAPVWTREYTVFSPVETTNYWKDPTFCDLDGDNDYDLIYGTDNGDLYFYKNTGSPASPQYVYDPSYFRIIKSDWSTPSFADVDGNLVLDMISGSTLGGFFYAKNTGNIYSPSFIQATAGFSGINPGFRCSPVFYDYDNDNDYDIVSGYSSGTLNLYINNNGTYSLNTTVFSNVSVTYASMPAFGDIDNDGDQDLLVGSNDAGTTKFYLNTGNNVFVENTQVFSTVSFPYACSPAFNDVDNDGDIDLFIGRSNGTVDFYENTGTPAEPVWTKNLLLMAGIKAAQNAHPSFADLDGDTRNDLILGEYNGNFTFYKNLFATVLPVELESFNAVYKSGKSELTWSTVSEINNRGFEIQRSIDKTSFNSIGFVKGTGTTTERQNYSYTDEYQYSGMVYYRLKQVDFNGVSKLSDMVAVNMDIPEQFILAQNYPNPFNPSTKIKFSIPAAAHVTLKLYDVTGNEIAVILNEQLEAGWHQVEINTENFSKSLSSGIYLYSLIAEGKVYSKKMLLLK